MLTPSRTRRTRIAGEICVTRLPQTAFWLLPVYVVWMTLCGVSAEAQMPANTIASPVKIADAQCAGCHREVFQNYLTTPMANASGPATERMKTGAFEHKTSGVAYSLSVENAQAMLSYQDRRNPQTSGKWKLNYFLGSGHLGITYLYSVNGYLFESPIAYYAASQSLDMKPGLEFISQLPSALPMMANCLRCHASAVRQSDLGTINHYNGSPFLHTGITCEACHGNTQQHLLTGGKAAVVNPAKLDAERRDSICISCHLEGDISVEHAGRSALDYKVGEPISNYLSYFVYEGKDATRRAVSEVEQLSLSACKRASGDKMSCTSCHDPHYTPTAQERTGFYREKCLACHSDAAFAVSHHPEKQDCTSCHMPSGGAENIPHVAWTDHRIRKLPESSEVMKDLSEGDTLVPVFSPHAAKRDIALAYYNALMEGNFALQQKAYHFLMEIKPEISGDKEALTALGILSEKRGDYKQATEIFEQVLKLEPNHLTAASNLGTLRAKSGDLPGAIAIWNPAFERNEDVVGLAKNLAQVQCMTGDAASARATLQKTLQYNPGLQDVLQMLAQLPACSAAKQ